MFLPKNISILLIEKDYHVNMGKNVVLMLQ